MITTPDLAFDRVTLSELDGLSVAELDRLPFGVVGLDAQGVVQVYNATEARLAGLRAERIVGVRFFEAVAQCMNNVLVAQRFEDEAELDATVPFVLTLRMRPTSVTLRLLAHPGARRRYVLIRR